MSISSLEKAQLRLSLGSVPVPPREVQFVGDGEFIAIASEFLGHFVRLGGLAPHHRVLDIGSGIGRMAAALACYLDSEAGSYVGFDPVQMGVSWCQSAFSAYPNFTFYHADVFNELYSPLSNQLSTQYRFPVADASIDFAVATSVFTHLYPEEVRAYFDETARVLNATGRLFATFFLYDGDAPPRSPARPHIDFSIRHERHRDVWHVADQPPLAAVAYSEAQLRSIAQRHIGRVPQIIPGRWRKAGGLAFQDIVLI